jgi:hypothetical protein
VLSLLGSFSCSSSLSPLVVVVVVVVLVRVAVVAHPLFSTSTSSLLLLLLCGVFVVVTRYAACWLYDSQTIAVHSTGFGTGDAAAKRYDGFWLYQHQYHTASGSNTHWVLGVAVVLAQSLVGGADCSRYHQSREGHSAQYRVEGHDL